MSISRSLSDLQSEIRNECLAAGRDPESVRLLLATKTVEPARIAEALKAGHRLLGENKVQELKRKFTELEPLQPEWHFIGHLQSNKVKDILPHIQMLHSLDRMSLVKELNRRLLDQGRTLDVLVQVNSSNEASKFGLPPEAVADFVEALKGYPTLKVKGLMTLALFSSDEYRVRECFQKMKRLFEELKGDRFTHVEMKELSMGMSSDYKWAIAEGATLLRVGTKVFGQRPYPDSYYWPEEK